VIQSVSYLSIILFFLSIWVWTATSAVFLELQVEYCAFGAWIKRWHSGLGNLWNIEHLNKEQLKWCDGIPVVIPASGCQTTNSFSHVTHASIWNVWKVVLSSCLDLWSQFRIAGDTRGKCPNLCGVHFCSQVHCEVRSEVLGSEREQVMRGWRKKQNYPLNVTIKSKAMSWPWHAAWMNKNNRLFGVVVGNPERNT
jgi:hypothetical protein